MNPDRDSQGRSGLLSGEPSVCPIPQEGHGEVLASLEELMRRLQPARRPPGARPCSASASLVLQSDEWNPLRKAAEMWGRGLDAFLLAGFSALLSRLAWQEAIPVLRLSTAPSLATFEWGDGISFRAALRAMGEEELSPDKPLGAGPAYQFLDSYTTAFPLDESDLLLTAKVQSGRLVMILASSTGRWEERTLEGWLDILRCLLLAASQAPDTPLRLLPLQDEAAILDFYGRLNRTWNEYPSEACVTDLIARQVALAPEAVAVVFGDRSLTYRELDRQSTLRAKRLAALGAGPNCPVAICMERSEQLPVALLAVLKSGSCYVPLDPQHPRQRIAMTLEECRPVAVLSDSVSAASLSDLSAPVLRMDEEWPEPPAGAAAITPASAEDLAYIIYTSGSTGKPKGVQVKHRSLVNLFDPMSRMPRLAPGDRLLAITTISFDIATLEMLLPLCSGATLVVADKYVSGDSFELARLLKNHDITFLQATPFTWRLLVNSGWGGMPGLTMACGGEALPRDLAGSLLPLGGALWNFYGPTETTIWSGAIRLEAIEGVVPLGPPIANTSFYVMDEAGRPLPPGVPGELYIGGAGVSPGYLARPELTALRFVADPFSPQPGATMFRTGDLVRALNERELEFMGRLDHQVKLRGYRIELAEIESVFRSHPAVENAVTILREDTPGEPRLVAYVTPAEGKSFETSELREHAARSLPEYMLPARIVTLAALPLTVSGKIDRRSLPQPESLSGVDHGKVPAPASVPPRNQLEAQLLEVFREVLHEPSIGVTDSFFDYGGYSLLTARLFSRIYRALGQKLPISLLFDAPTARGLAQLIQKGEPLPIVVPIRREGRAAPLFVIHSYLIYSALSKAIVEDRPIYGVRELDGDDELPTTVEERAAIYAGEIAQVYPDGPLSLAGWCLAGSLTVEVARVLREQGRIVALVALFDSERPGYKPRLVNGGNLWKARLESFTRFHSDRMRDLDWQERARYLTVHSKHRWEDVIEALSIWQRAVFRWLHRNTAFALPGSMKKRLARMGADELRPSGQQLYPGKIVLFRASDVARISGTEPSLGWDEVAKDGVVVEFAPGDHESMFRDPHLRQFGKILQRALREGEASCGFSAASVPS